MASGGHDLPITRLGPLDLLGSVGNSHDFPDLLPHAIAMDVGEGTTIQVLGVETVIAVKEETDDDKDRAVLLILRRTLEELRRE